MNKLLTLQNRGASCRLPPGNGPWPSSQPALSHRGAKTRKIYLIVVSCVNKTKQEERAELQPRTPFETGLGNVTAYCNVERMK